MRKVSAVVFSLADTLDWPLKSVWNSNLLLLMSKVAAGASPPRQIWFDCFEPTTSEVKRVTTRMECMLFIAETWIFVAFRSIKPGKSRFTSDLNFRERRLKFNIFTKYALCVTVIVVN